MYGDCYFFFCFLVEYISVIEKKLGLIVIQYNAMLEITGATLGSSSEKLCQELGLKYL